MERERERERERDCRQVSCITDYTVYVQNPRSKGGGGVGGIVWFSLKVWDNWIERQTIEKEKRKENLAAVIDFQSHVAYRTLLEVTAKHVNLDCKSSRHKQDWAFSVKSSFTHCKHWFLGHCMSSALAYWMESFLTTLDCTLTLCFTCATFVCVSRQCFLAEFVSIINLAVFLCL